MADKRNLRAPLSVSTLNVNVINSEYAVRGEIVGIAQRIAKDLEEGKGSYPFDKVVWCNIGNPQILGQKPITYFRQVRPPGADGSPGGAHGQGVRYGHSCGQLLHPLPVAGASAGVSRR